MGTRTTFTIYWTDIAIPLRASNFEKGKTLTLTSLAVLLAWRPQSTMKYECFGFRYKKIVWLTCCLFVVLYRSSSTMTELPPHRASWLRTSARFWRGLPLQNTIFARSLQLKYVPFSQLFSMFSQYNMQKIYIMDIMVFMDRISLLSVIVLF